MKKAWLVLMAVLVVLSPAILRADEQKEECVMPPAYTGSAEFQKIKSLAGTWEAPDPTNISGDGKTRVTYEVTSNGYAVLERFNPGTPSEMVSIYHDEKGKLAMTHYCAIGNRPRLALESASGNEIKLSLAKGSGINPKTEDHMHAVRLVFAGPDEIQQEWWGYKAGKPMAPMSIALKRVK